ncbi:hypothetical protein MUO14_20995 [Halobacillus shinanisalinarum]|uniref:Uncharacterized protein n=1 Tax=Halobacillus shinanisalinarum TaxID=2932258 RepID=A0ABY4H1K9_9BACI|nr:hypothetical protein [Halobacillus shinanisalinarum]UOQ92857.1 hypothetical protein MUO14_20995 [Halobacillus shinanisalinarum]
MRRSNGVIKQPEKRFNGWQHDFDAWEQRFSKRMMKLESELNKQMKKLDHYFE